MPRLTMNDYQDIITDTYGLDVEQDYDFTKHQTDLHNVTAKEIMEIGQDTFKKEKLTPEELNYIITMTVPSSYMLANHTIGGNPMMFQVSNYDPNLIYNHRPWQQQLADDQHTDKIIMKSRQLGLSELGVADLLFFTDTYSDFKVNALYTFPK